MSPRLHQTTQMYKPGFKTERNLVNMSTATCLAEMVILYIIKQKHVHLLVRTVVQNIQVLKCVVELLRTSPAVFSLFYLKLCQLLKYFRDTNYS